MKKKLTKNKNNGGSRIIPGFSLTLGITITMLSLFILMMKDINTSLGNRSSCRCAAARFL